MFNVKIKWFNIQVHYIYAWQHSKKHMTYLLTKSSKINVFAVFIKLKVKLSPFEKSTWSVYIHLSSAFPTSKESSVQSKYNF